MEEWLAGLIGAIIGAIVSFFAAFFTLRFNYKQLYAQTVSSSRNIWLNEMRENISIMLAEACKAGNEHKPKEFYIAQNQVLLRMNNNEPLHLMLTQEIQKLEKCNAKTFPLYSSNILKISEMLLKREWEHVKKEAKGGK